MTRYPWEPGEKQQRRCPGPDCHRRLRPNEYACAACLSLLPPDVRDEVVRAWTSGGHGPELWEPQIAAHAAWDESGRLFTPGDAA